MFNMKNIIYDLNFDFIYFCIGGHFFRPPIVIKLFIDIFDLHSNFDKIFFCILYNRNSENSSNICFTF